MNGETIMRGLGIKKKKKLNGLLLRTREREEKKEDIKHQRRERWYRRDHDIHQVLWIL